MRRRTRTSKRGRRSPTRADQDAHRVFDDGDWEAEANALETAPVEDTDEPEATAQAEPDLYDVYGPPRPPRKRYAFAAAFVLSFLLHLSAVALFRIEVHFPESQVRYFDLAIVEAMPQPGAQPPRRPGLQMPAFDPEALVDEQPVFAGMPALDLPTIQFAELSRLRLRRRGLAEATPTDGDSIEATLDTWAQFGRELRRLTGSLPVPESPISYEHLRVAVHPPADGFAAYVEWEAAPVRGLLFSPPLDALYDLDAARKTEPIEIVLTVDASGHVASVWTFLPEDSPAIDRVQASVLKNYRFESAPASGPELQQGVLRIEAVTL